jgi:hypothetical protein
MFELFELERPATSTVTVLERPPDPNLLHWACPWCHRAPASPLQARCSYCIRRLSSPSSALTTARRTVTTRNKMSWTEDHFQAWLAWIDNGLDDDELVLP